MRATSRHIRFTSATLGALVVVGVLQAVPATGATDGAPDVIADHVDAAVSQIGAPDSDANALPASERLDAKSVDVSDQLSITLPEQFTGATARPAKDGTAILTGEDGESLSVKSLDDGVRLSTVVSSDTQEHSFTYRLPEGATVEEQADGSLLVLGDIVPGEDGGEVVPILATVHPAWAVDAEGASVKTSYTLSDDAITQTVEPSQATAYPIVADPQFQFLGYQYRIRFNKAETNTVSDWGAASAAFAGATCAAAASGTGPVLAAAVGAACAVGAAGAGVAASNAKYAGKCVQGTFTPIPPVIPGTPLFVAWWDGYTGGNCK